MSKMVDVYLIAAAGLLIFTISYVSGHAAVVYPPPRNAIDHDILPWTGPVPNPIPGVDAWCPYSEKNGSLTGKNGQSCFWFSNGCSIGCPECDGVTRGPIPYLKNHTNKTDICGLGYSATICDPKLRTVNTGAECGAKDDFYYYSPWRAPGSAPVFDPCGMAGGNLGGGQYGAQYKKTPHAKQGDLGSKTLPERRTGTFWQTGSIVEVGWAVQSNHGGGYQYRLCPKNEPLTEKCFQRMPLKFTGKQGFRWPNEEDLFFERTVVSKGTIPKGSQWAMNPLPRNDPKHTFQSFEPRCNESPDCNVYSTESSCRCSGLWGPFNLTVVDFLEVPALIQPGEYVLGWRWDCEESTQIWSSCSDITIIGNSSHTN